MSRRPLATITGAAVVLSLLAACGGDDDDDGSDAGVPTELLARVPADAADGAVVTYVDMDDVWERLGVGDATADERFEQLGRTGELETFAMPPPLFGAMSALREDAVREVGFDVTAIEEALEVSAPPRTVTVAEVAVPPSAIAGAVESDPAWSALLSSTEVDGWTRYEWGDEMHLEGRGPLRPLGMAGQLLVEPDGDDGSTVVRTADAATTDAVVAGDGDSLADAAWVDELGRLVPGDLVQFMVVTDAAPYDAIVVAEATDDSTTTAAALLVYADDDAAAADVARVRELVASGTLPSTGRPASDVLPDATVDQDGRTVRIAMEGTGRFARLPAVLARRDLVPA